MATAFQRNAFQNNAFQIDPLSRPAQPRSHFGGPVIGLRPLRHMPYGWRFYGWLLIGAILL